MLQFDQKSNTILPSVKRYFILSDTQIKPTWKKYLITGLLFPPSELFITESNAIYFEFRKSLSRAKRSNWFCREIDGYQAKASVVYAAVNLKNPAATARTATMTPEAKTPVPRPHVTSLLIGSVRAFNQSMAV